MTVNSRPIKTYVGSSRNIEIPLQNGLKLQILPSMNDLPKARKYQFAAFCASEGLLVVWDDDAKNLVKRAKSIESELMELIWQADKLGDTDDEYNEKQSIEIDAETGEPKPEQRPIHLINSTLVAFTLIIVITLLGLAARSLSVEIAVDKNYLRLAFLALVPIQIFFTLVSLRRSSFELR